MSKVNHKPKRYNRCVAQTHTLVQHQEELLSLTASHEDELLLLAASYENELRSLETELESHRQILSQQDEQLRSSSEQIEHLKLVIEKLRRRVFGVKSEKIVVQLEQLELHLEELESSQAEMEAAVERVRPTEEPKTRSRRKPLPEHLPREVVSHTFHGDSCPVICVNYSFHWTTTIFPYRRHLPPSVAGDIYLRFR